ncbi:fused chemotaxis regulator; protein-glutamate methylesterase in two-component regulatory system with CheA [uncultured Stenotrophomonas sp.]|uniref:Protein-glutamate methylesterase/protein-glutamine glutaminase n=1 Tax=uncultured Stenotrophomonas sp. TaxID=165438 RepID=A0A1Y5Q1G6_9GAMM|nr:fused chemotaxis regulator; protein-glutamate methylesterase in two-component regulatory system with CheA [uncultured Stenotrophomonas sp.]
MSPQQPCRVLIVDDSALVRQILSDLLARDPGIEVVGTASDPLIARDKIKRLNPDVLTLDVEMPRMDGLAFLESLMRLHPLPVVMVSSLTERGADTTLQALALGAVDFVAKPKLDVARGLEGYAEEICAKVKAAARSRVRALAVPSQPKRTLDTLPASSSAPSLKFRTTDRLIAIGSSAGGTEALRVVLEMMPADAPAIVASLETQIAAVPGAGGGRRGDLCFDADAPAIVLTQHLPASFSSAFAERLDRHSAMSVREASDGEAILPGHAYLPVGGRHLRIIRDGARWRCRIDDSAPVNLHKPAVDVLFRSVAQNAGANAVGAILTGMGDDGARGLLEMKQAGARTLVQDEATSVVWGMPGAAFKLGAADEVVPLEQVAARLLAWSQQG